MNKPRFRRPRRRLNTFQAGLLILTAAAAAVLIPNIRKGADPAPGSVDSWARAMDGQVPALMERYKVPGVSMALISKGKTVWSAAYGYAELESLRSMTVDTPCRVESISKSVTAWGVMKLVQQGLVDLDAPAATYLGDWTLPETPYDEEKVTVRRLLSQTAGMPLGTIGVRYNPDVPLPDLEEHLSREAVLFREPGTGFSYSNAGYNVLELLIEKVTGEDFAAHMAREVLFPLGMRNSSFRWDRTWNPGVPDGYDIDGTAYPAYIYPDKASGGLFAPVEDVAAFVCASMPLFDPRGPRVLDSRFIDTIHSDQAELQGYYSLVFDGYGFGHFTEVFPGGVRGISHGGQGSGWMTHFHAVPETGDGIVILANSQRSWPLFSTLLDRWGRWAGHSPVGMGLIARAAAVLKVFLNINLVVLLMLALRIIRDLAAGRRRMEFSLRLFCGPRILIPVLALGLAGAVAFISRMPYFFLSSVFPAETPWLGTLMLIWAGVLGILFILPPTGRSGMER
jgi:CubicO group peptidase (beta-lactamase class C family)